MVVLLLLLLLLLFFVLFFGNFCSWHAYEFSVGAQQMAQYPFAIMNDEPAKMWKFWVKYPHHMYVISTNRKEIYIRFFMNVIWTLSALVHAFFHWLLLLANNHFTFYHAISHIWYSRHYITNFMVFGMYICHKDVVHARPFQTETANYNITFIRSTDECLLCARSWEVQYIDLGFIRRRKEKRYYSKKLTVIPLHFFSYNLIKTHPLRCWAIEETAHKKENRTEFFR